MTISCSQRKSHSYSHPYVPLLPEPPLPISALTTLHAHWLRNIYLLRWSNIKLLCWMRSSFPVMFFFFKFILIKVLSHDQIGWSDAQHRLIPLSPWKLFVDFEEQPLSFIAITICSLMSTRWYHFKRNFSSMRKREVRRQPLLLK